MPFAEKPPEPPTQDVPFVDPATGRIAAVWYQWLIKYVAYLARLGAAIP